MASLSLVVLLALVLAVTSEGTYGRRYGYAIDVSPRRRIVVKAIPAKHLSYSGKGTAVFRSPYDSYDEADAVRTADADVRYKPPYQPVVVHKKTVHVPDHVVHDIPVVHSPKVRLGHSDHVVHVGHDEAHVAHVPYHYDYHVVPECALANQHVYNITVCLDDAAYPTEAILHQLKKDPALTDKLMSDVTYQSADNLVDGLTKAEEEQYSRHHYYGEAVDDSHLPQIGYAYSAAYQREGGYICPSDVFYARVKRAVNTFGEWKVIVNLPDAFKHDPKYKKYVQTSRLESCVHPGTACSFVDHLFPSACLQKHAFVRLVAYDHKHGLHVDSFKLPSACSCHLAAKGGVYHV